MKRPFLAQALTWDGARWPVRSLPPAARKFLSGGFSAHPKKVAELFQAGEVHEVRICWVPALRGGEETMNLPFAVPGGKRISFQVKKMVSFGDVLGVIYRIQ